MFGTLIKYKPIRVHRLPLIERLFEKLEKTDSGCWLWRGDKNKYGYGKIDVEGHSVGTHRVAWFLLSGVWPGDDVLHKCDVRLCVRFSHLFLGDDLMNARDKSQKGRAYRPTGEKHHNVRLNEDKVRQIRIQYSSGDHSYGTLGKIYSVNPWTIRAVVKRQTWPHVQ